MASHSQNPKINAHSDSEGVAEKPAQSKRIGGRHSSQAHGEEEGEGEPWLLSYADMVTLLMCFFVLFFTLDKSKGAISDPERVSKRLAKAIALDFSSASSAVMQGGQNDDGFKKDLSSELYKMSHNLKVVFALSQPNPETIVVTFLNSHFFQLGSAELTDDAKQTVDNIAKKILALSLDRVQIEVEGHTDSTPIQGSKIFPSNWELSAARATAVVRYLIGRGVPSKIFKATGYADQRPIVKERDGKGNLDMTAQRLNRRIEVRIVRKVPAVSGSRPSSPPGAGPSPAK